VASKVDVPFPVGSWTVPGFSYQLLKGTAHNQFVLLTPSWQEFLRKCLYNYCCSLALPWKQVCLSSRHLAMATVQLLFHGRCLATALHVKILRLMSENKIGWYQLVYPGSGYGTVEASCEHANKASGSIKCWGILHWLAAFRRWYEVSILVMWRALSSGTSIFWWKIRALLLDYMASNPRSDYSFCIDFYMPYAPWNVLL
jgi:hypothetical protein